MSRWPWKGNHHTLCRHPGILDDLPIDVLGTLKNNSTIIGSQPDIFEAIKARN
jgi:hypothetical protein